MRPTYTADDFEHSPFVVFYEVTRACDLVCQHCRACAQPKAHPSELRTSEATRMLNELARFPKPPLLVLTGGDPLKRPDLLTLIAHARQIGLSVALTPSATPLVTPEAIAAVRDAGVGRIAVSLDGKDAATHDALRGVPGSFDLTRQITHDVQKAGLPLQVNTTVAAHNIDQIDAIADLLADVGVVLWSVFFLVPVGRALTQQRLTAEQCEQAFDRLYHHATTQPYAVKATEAPHYRRYVLQRGGNPIPGGRGSGRAPLGVNDGKGVMFISHVGQVFPTGFLPIECGRFPRDSVIEAYQRAPLMRRLRDPSQLKGKCGVCEFADVCGGSRARAYAVTRDPLAADPDCAYVPPVWARERV